MTGYQSKKAAALDEEGMYLVHHTAQPVQEFGLTRERFNALEVEITTLQAEWQSALKEVERLKAAHLARERNFCERCGKRTADLTTIHTCTPPQEKNNG